MSDSEEGIYMEDVGKSIATIAIWACVFGVAYFCKDYNFGWGFLATLILWG